MPEDKPHYLDRELPPDPAVLLRSLRGIGYSVEDAVADIVDNSIAARAQNVDIWLHSLEHDLVVDMGDDGEGLTREELMIALTLGARERDPDLTRRDHDLGRFGLGLKTASFSVAQRLSVYAMKDGVACGAAWDLATVARTGRWRLSPLSELESAELSSRLSDRSAGTVVRWSRVDRLQQTPGGSRAVGVARLEERLRRHLGMTYHRFLDGLDADGTAIPRTSISINGRAIAGWNPLLPFVDRPELVQFGEVRMAHGIRVEYAVLPPEVQMHAEERDQATLEGRRLTDMQGFYVYRGNRLVCFANWLGLPGYGSGRWNKDSSTQLARIAVDLTNADDEEWSLDVRKSRVTPPERVRPALIEIGAEARARSRSRIFGRSGSARNEGPDPRSESLWTMEQGRLQINREHPLVSSIVGSTDGIPKAVLVAVRSLLRQLESSPALVAFVSEQGARDGGANPPPPEVLDDADFGEALDLARFLLRSGRSLASVLAIASEDPRYGNNPDLLERLRARLETR